MSVNSDLLRESWALVADVSDKVAAQFYGMLFSRYPAIRMLFPPGMDSQRDRLLGALTYFVLNLDDMDAVTRYLRELARDHRKFDVRPEHYPALGRCLVAAMKANAAGRWRPEHEEAWLTAYNVIAGVMIEAAREDEPFSPPYWSGRVVAHELRSPDIAVVTIDPLQPYRFHAGQYTTIQTARWPRIWRAYSIANAPRTDNLVTFHVRLVPGGWVSTALAHQTAVGDTVLLGPPRGDLTLPPDPPDRLLCLAGGTGLAPLKALIEEMLRSVHNPDITLVHGVRKRAELYDTDHLMRMAAASGRFRIVTAISDDPDHRPGQTVTDVLGREDLMGAPMTYVCGPGEMVLATLDHLSRLGMPAHRIRSEPDVADIAGRLRVHTPT